MFESKYGELRGPPRSSAGKKPAGHEQIDGGICFIVRGKKATLEHGNREQLSQLMNVA